MLTSARNHFAGKVGRISRGAVNDEVELKLPGGAKIVAIITHESTEVLGLRKGVEAIALIKASWIIVSAEGSDAPLKLSARNQLRGVVSTLSPGAINTEVVIELKGGQSVAAIITKASADAMGLAPGKPATAIFKASSVILGVAG
jgi:molybdate transport system regulatory protein